MTITVRRTFDVAEVVLSDMDRPDPLKKPRRFIGLKFEAKYIHATVPTF
jgi:hypothetical protein